MRQSTRCPGTEGPTMTGQAHRAVRVASEPTYLLRSTVLGRPPTAAELRGDVADWGHYAVAIHGSVVATGVTHPRQVPATVGDHRSSWRIIGMAVDPRHRGHGLGSAVLDALIDHVRNADGQFVWCHARTEAAEFYLRHGFTQYPEVRHDPVAGPQILLGKPLQQ